MSLFDKDIVERPIELPKDMTIRYALEWIVKNAQRRLIDKKEFIRERFSLIDFRTFCIDYLKTKCGELFESLINSEPPKNIPAECKKFPEITRYNVNVKIDEQIATLSSDPHSMTQDIFLIDIKYLEKDDEDGDYRILRDFSVQIVI